MTSPAKDKQHTTPRNRRRLTVIVVVALALIGGGWHLWDHYGTHNIFDAIMDSEWTVLPTVHKPNPALEDKYKGWLAQNPTTHYRQRLQYRSSDDTIVYVTITPDTDKAHCSEYGCETTYWHEKTPTELEISYEERITQDTSFVIETTYDRHTHSLHEQVQVYQRHDGSFLIDNEAAAVLAEHGITGDHLRQKRDWLLYEKVLPDFLATNHQVHYTARNWGWVKVTEDHFLTP